MALIVSGTDWAVVRQSAKQARPAKPVILTVDDDEGVRASYSLILEGEYEVLEAPDGPTALEIFRSRQVDMVLLDILMPGMDGLEVLARMKAADPRIEVILVSAVAEVPTVVKAMKFGAFDYLPKPFDDRALTGAVQHALRRRSEGVDVLLVGADVGALAALKIVLEQYVPVAMALPLAASLVSGGNLTPKLVVFDSTLSPGEAACFVRTLRQQLPSSRLVVLTPDMARALLVPELASLPNGTLVQKPCPLDELLDRIAEMLSAGGERSASWPRLGPHVLKAIDYVTHHYREPITVQEIASAAGLSADRLAHVFREALGMAVKDYVTRLRIEVARHLLTTTDRKLDDIAQFAGFGDASYLSRVFTRRVGECPSAYRHRSGEIQLTSGLRALCGKRPLYAVEFEGKRYDTGDKLGFLKATVEFALARPDLADAFREYLKGFRLDPDPKLPSR